MPNRDKKIKTKPRELKHINKQIRFINPKSKLKKRDEDSKNEENYAIDEVGNYTRATKRYLKVSRKRISNKAIQRFKASQKKSEKALERNAFNRYYRKSLKQDVKYSQSYFINQFGKHTAYQAKQRGTTIFNKLFKASANTVKYTYKAANFLAVFILPILVLIICITIVGMLLAPSPVEKTESQPLSEDVLRYSEVVSVYCTEFDIEEYIPLVLAVMQQESGGQGNDPMQSSECEYNEEYPNIPNGIEDSEYSIKVGVRYLADCLNLAKIQSPSDIDKIALALQGYNYGKGYIEWALQNFGGYSRFNAYCFSEMKKQELETNVYGDPDYVSHVLRFYT